MKTQRDIEAHEAIEELIRQYSDVFIQGDDQEEFHMPILSAWVLVTVHDDAVNPAINASYRMCRYYQASHESIGLLTLAMDDLRHISVNDD